jgi:hypothetical protein
LALFAQEGGGGAPAAPHELERLCPGVKNADWLWTKAGAVGCRKGELGAAGAGPCHEIVRWRLERGAQEAVYADSYCGAFSGHNTLLALKFSGVPGAEYGDGG